MKQHGTVGVAISETAMYAILPSVSSSAGGRDGRERAWPLTPIGRADADWPSLTAALTELRQTLPQSDRTLTVTLLPPLVQARRIELPKMRAEDRRALLSRSAGKYLPGVREPHIANGTPLGGSSPAPHIMMAGAARLIESVTRSVLDSGWTLATIGSAYDAWVTSAQHQWASLRDNDGDVAVPWNSHVELLQIEDGKLAGIRRVRSDEVNGARSSTTSTYTLEQPAYAAATAGPENTGVELLPERIYTARSRVRRQWNIRFGVAAVILAVLAAAGVLIHAQYVLHQVQAQRDAIAPQAKRAAAAQGDYATIAGPLNSLGKIETNAVRWSDIVADLTDVFPPDASLTSFRGHGDSLALAGVATHGADVFERMDGAKLVDRVQSSGPIRREMKEGAPSVDRFQFVARIPGITPLYAPKQPNGKRP